MRFPKPKGTPIVNHNAFTDARPVLGGKSTTYNPTKGPLPSGAPRFVNAPGQRTKAVTQSASNKRY